MNRADAPIATYENFLQLSDRLTTELDRFTDLMRANKSVLDHVGQYTEHVDSTSIQIKAQVQEVLKAWTQADQTAAQAAQLAYKSAFEGVRSSLHTVTQELARSVRANDEAAVRIKKSQKFIYWSAFGCMAASFFAVFAASYFASSRPSAIDDQIRLNAAGYERIFNNANTDDRRRLNELLQAPRVKADKTR